MCGRRTVNRSEATKSTRRNKKVQEELTPNHSQQNSKPNDNNKGVSNNLPSDQVSKKSTRKEQYYTKQQLEALRSRSSEISLTTDQAMFIIQQGWNLINKNSSKNKKFLWRWSGFKNDEALQVIMQNYKELHPVISKLKEGNKRGKKKNLPTANVDILDFKNSEFESVPVVDKEKVSLILEFYGKLLHFGDGMMDLS